MTGAIPSYTCVENNDFKVNLSVAGTLETVIAPPVNDACVDAITLTCGDMDIAGTTTEGTDDNPGACGTAGDGDSAGVWYTFTGTGDDVTVALYSPPGGGLDVGQIAVYSGDCASLVCVGGDQHNGSVGDLAEVAFASVLGTNYYFYVDGWDLFEGDFEISIDCVGPPPDNDLCVDAVLLACGDMDIAGTTTDGTDNNPGYCNDGGDGIDAGVWYTFSGTGDGVTVTINPDPGTGNDIDFSQIAVYSGDCTSLVCVDGESGGTDHQVYFSSVIGTNYYFYVDGHSPAGDFEISIECNEPPDNDLCVNAEVLECGDMDISGTTTGASDNNPGYCNGAGDGFSSGVWYTFVGTGEAIEVTINDDPGTGNDLNNAQLAVYSGDCSTLVCVDGNDNAPGGYGSQVTFTSVLDTDYYFYVDGWNSTFQGDFEISVECTGPPDNDLCADAIALDCTDVDIPGTTSGGTDNNPGTCGTGGDGDSPGVWYIFAGTGYDVTVTVNALPPNTGNYLLSGQIAVYSGDCASLVCESGDEENGLIGDMAEVTFTSALGTNYYFYIDGKDTNDGEFEISVEDCTGPPPGNDLCEDAEVLECGDMNIAGTNTDATDINFPGICNSAGDSKGVWYTFVGTDDEVTVTVNADPGTGNDLDNSRLAVYSGDCTSFVCVDGNNNSDPPGGGGSQVVFISSLGTNYYFYVEAWSIFEGDFEISVECTEAVQLPIDLIKFEGRALEVGNQLLWSTASEINNSHFILESSFNGVDNWTEVVQVEGAGNSSVRIDYSAVDITTAALSYYRLTSFDYDGSFEVSDIIAISRDRIGSEQTTFTLSPNPASNNASIDILSTQDERFTVEVEIMSLNGKVIFTQRVSLNENKSKVILDLDGYSNGIYLVNLYSQDQKVSKKLVISK